jgi:hypothetical protein
MSPGPSRSASRTAGLLLISALAAVLTAGLGLAVIAFVISAPAPGPGCSSATGPAGAQTIELSAGAGGQRVGATEYGGPGDPSSGIFGSMGANLLQHPDTYAELGGGTFETATAMGGLAYMTPLRVTWGAHSAIAYKRDIGLGGGPVDGLPRVIDLWWQFAGALGIPYEHGLWSGPVSVSRPPAGGAGNVLASSPGTVDAADTAASEGASTGCTLAAAEGVPLTGGSRAKLLSNGQAAAPAGAPAAVQGIIAAGNQIAGKPYLYGGGHGVALDQVASTYDCSSSVEHLLYGGRLLPVTYDAASGELESFGRPGPGRWVTIFASADHVFMYVAGLRWDTHNAAGAGDGSTGIGWHPLVRSSAGFVERHPVGL